MICNYKQKTLCSNNDCIICFNRSFSSHIKTKYWSAKNNIQPRNVFKTTNKKYLFNCPNCNHEILISLSGINRGRWCPYCSNNMLCTDLNCISCYEKSFASVNKAQYWSKKNKLIPRYVAKYSAKKYLFDCDCGHEFQAIIHRVTNNSWCPYCSTPPKILCSKYECKSCFDKSFASSDKAKCWSNKNQTEPRYVLKHSSKLVIFKCDTCMHEFNSTLSNISSGHWCNYCAGLKLCNDKQCVYCYERSFASVKESKYWSNKNTINPRDISKNTHEKYIFDCYKCRHEFTSSICNITCNSQWCPKCKISKMEKILNNVVEQLSQHMKIRITEQYRYKDCKDISVLPFDAHITFERNNIYHQFLVELQGQQHFESNSYHNCHINNNFFNRLRKDRIKAQYCLSKNIHLISISYLCQHSINKIINDVIENLTYKEYRHYITSTIYITPYMLTIPEGLDIYDSRIVNILTAYQYILRKTNNDTLKQCFVCKCEYISDLHHQTRQHNNNLTRIQSDLIQKYKDAFLCITQDGNSIWLDGDKM